MPDQFELRVEQYISHPWLHSGDSVDKSKLVSSTSSVLSILDVHNINLCRLFFCYLYPFIKEHSSLDFEQHSFSKYVERM